MKPYAYVINDYQKQKPFASFLSGVAGKMGVPMWAFYVNRGQLIASFGVRNKNGAIMEFYPANQAYHYVPTIGFRTFIKVDDVVHEFFKESNSGTSLTVRADQVSIEEKNESLGLIVNVTYFTLPNEPIAGLVRKVTIQNLNKEQRTIEIIDGLAQILPSGIDYGGYKAISNLLQSWMANIHEPNYVFYKLRASTGDSAEVKDVTDGNFYMTYGLEDAFYISDYKLIFDEDTTLQSPYPFIQNDIQTLKERKQAHVNQVPCAMTGASLQLDDQHHFYSIIGYANDKHMIDAVQARFDVNKLDQKTKENEQLHLDIVSPMETKTSQPILDAYFRQCYLDNVLRGGMPWLVDTNKGPIGYYIYSRKHGDLERDYNFFHLEPSFFSQGNGNFRDVLQNRRNDIFFNPSIGDFNIYQFASLIQADGYNPLSIEGVEFLYEGDAINHDPKLNDLLNKPYTPGILATYLSTSSEHVEKDLRAILKHSRPIIKAQFGEGYWEDHFTYLLDVVESYLDVFPDQLKPLMFDKTYPFFTSPAKVLPRSEKYVKTQDGKIRQYGAVLHREGPSGWLKNDEGTIEVNLFGKLLTLVLNKYGHLDPYGIGLSYEAEKPGWNDAANGIPGLFGSGVSETIELSRIVSFLREVIKKHRDAHVTLLSSTEQLQKALLAIAPSDDFTQWDERMSALEHYRAQLETPQKTTILRADQCDDMLSIIEKALNRGLEKAKAISPIYPTYLTYEAVEYTPYVDASGQPKIGHYGLPLVKVSRFELKELPHFLEGPARYLKSKGTPEEGLKIHQAVNQTDMYDQKLGIYQTSESLEACSHEIGRLRAFTPGWLERESDFLHMTYKYLLGLLKAGLYDAYFEAIKTNFTCFMDPKVYGRSPIENSSFIATSSNPDPKKHGQGFVSRLTGSTAEVLSMWRYMFIGAHPFTWQDEQLIFSLDPKLPATFFADGIVSFKLFDQITVTYHNPKNLNTYDSTAVIHKIVLTNDDGTIEVQGNHVFGHWAKDIRNGKMIAIDVYFDTK